jgi:hypothetical protein
MSTLATYGIVALVMVVLIGGAIKYIYDDGIKAQQIADRTAATALVVERDKIDAKNKHATPNDICQRLGGTQLMPDGQCN